MLCNPSIPVLAGRVFYIVLVAVFLFSGCGKKAPPVVPSQAPVVGVKDLKGEIDKGVVRLTWYHPSENARAAGYVVLRAQSALSKPDCPECPQVYQRVGKIPVSRASRDKRHQMEHYETVAKGFKYIYNVRPYVSSMARGPNSNLITLTRPKE